MLRCICCLFAAISIAIGADAASLSVSSDKLTYNVGETITLTVFADDEGTTAYGIFGRLLYNGALVDNGTRSQTILTGPEGAWTPSVLLAGDTNANVPDSAFSRAFIQVTLEAQGANNLPGNLSTITLIAKALGIVDLAWDTADPNELSFFGLTDAPGTSFTIVPEPATATLIGLGLLALGVAQRRRSIS